MSETHNGSSVRSLSDTPTVLSVEHVSKAFRLPTEQASGIKQAMINWTRGIKGYREQNVLRDVSFAVKQGDFFGIVGRNGSGKSTLLKLISGIYMPEHGNITVNGKLVPFIELGVGFNPELTGRENVFLNGALLGFSHDEVEAMYDDIVEFAELEEFMDQKLKNYSSGMQVRLAFSVAIQAKGDILVLDEVLAVGDEAFQRKCDNFFAEIKRDPSKTVILVTHNMDSVKKYCNRAILIQNGEVVVNGDKDDAADRYTLENNESRAVSASTASKAQQRKSEYPTGLNERVPVLRIVPRSPLVCDNTEPFRFAVEYEFNEQTEAYVAVALHDIKRGGIPYDSGDLTFPVTEFGRHAIEFEMPLNIYNNGDFKIVSSLRTRNRNDPDTTDMVAFTSGGNCCEFSIRNSGKKDFALLNDSAASITRLSQRR